uniref:Uncharacterized protein LOC107427790 n=1 Tax=Rhizophora mucronata TaxID=61149 RepID=A0A2P2KF35_RHIMU
MKPLFDRNELQFTIQNFMNMSITVILQFPTNSRLAAVEKPPNHVLTEAIPIIDLKYLRSPYDSKDWSR